MSGPTVHRAGGAAPAAAPPASVVTVGTFDGVHRGHVAVVDAVRERARRLSARSVVVTFEPHPLRVVRPEDAPRLLTTPEEKVALLRRTGVDLVATLPFTRELAAYSPDRFVREILIERYGMVHMVVGYDHGLGRGRSGDVDTLCAIGAELGFGVDVVSPLLLDDQPISSTRIRAMLARGDVEGAAAALGRTFTLTGAVVHGDGRGRDLGFPTANLKPSHPDRLVPEAGIYAVRAHIGRANGERSANAQGGGAREAAERGTGAPAAGDHATAGHAWLDGVLHIGPRPTFPGAEPTIELHLFDFDADLYGRTITIAFCTYVRPVRAFADAAALAAAIEEDCRRARAVLARGAGACQDPMDVVT